ncbi:uncharacterized protein [Typha latifolia]|uniref:uncharacterized protein n=1 Tax=Typha latifolia TaxID=4733 RepID=UPI003C2C0E3A
MMGGLALKDQCTNLPRRRSLRLKGISAIYDAEDGKNVDSHSKLQEKGSGRNTYYTGNSVKVEVLDPEENTAPWISENGVTVASVSNRNDENSSSQEGNKDIDEQNPLEISLKDLRARCKVKKQKVRKSVSSVEVDISSILHHDQSTKWNATIMKMKEEEPDLEEPLINLKLKRSKAFPININKRKGACLSSQCLDLIDVVSSNRYSSNSANIPISTATEYPCAGMLAKDSDVDLEDSKSAAGHDAENLRMGGKNMFIESNKPYLSSEHEDLYAGSPDVVCHVKSEVFDTSSSLGVDMNANSTSEIDFFDSSSGEALQKVGNRNSDSRKLTFTSEPVDICHDLSELNLKNPALIYSTKTGSLDDDIVMHEKTIGASSVSMNFIAKAICPQKSSAGQVEITNGNVLASVDLTSLPDKYTSCCLNESCDDYMGNNEYFCRPESVQECLGETTRMEQSKILTDEHKEVSFNGYSSESVCTTVFPGSDICRSTESQSTSHEELLCKTTVEQLDISITCHRDNIMEIKDKGAGNNDTDTEGVPAQEIPVCTDMKDGVLDSIFLCNEVHDFVDNSNFGAQDGQLESIVYDAITTSYMQIKSNETTTTDMSDVPAIVTRSLSTDQLSNTCFHAAKFSPISNESSLNTQTALSSIEGESSEVQTGKTTYDSSEMYGLIEEKGSTLELDLQPHICQPCSNIKDIDEESRGGEKPSSSEQSTSTRISQEIEEAAVNMKKELRNNKKLTEEHAPKKLLSKRKIMSPTSQEKLCHTFDLCDRTDTQISGSEAAQSFLYSERILKKSKSSSNTSVSPVAKGILKAAETSHRTACYCMKSSSTQIDTEKVIEFSQRQMRDVENIALKLLKSLKSMKNIVEESLSSEALSSEFTAEEMRAASEDASELDRITRRWLTIMSKDCNRFCKILRLTEDKTATPANGLRKDRRKITFADEAGGMLCHVKLFSQQPDSLAPGHEKAG